MAGVKRKEGDEVVDDEHELWGAAPGEDWITVHYTVRLAAPATNAHLPCSFHDPDLGLFAGWGGGGHIQA